VLSHLDEFEYIAACAAGEAFEDLLGWIDVETGSVVIVEGAETYHFAAFFLERDVLAYDISDVIGLLNLAEYCLVESAGHFKLIPPDGGRATIFYIHSTGQRRIFTPPDGN
jgi:hypothetical protein